MENGELFDAKNREIIIGIDPGPTTSGQVVADCSIFPPIILESNSEAEESELVKTKHDAKIVVCEWLISYSTVVGSTVLDTARLIGRIEERAETNDLEFYRFTKPEINLEVADLRRAKKAQVNEAIRQLYKKHWQKLGGGMDPTKGTKKKPGPLYGIKGHAWDALAVIIAWMIINR